MSQAPASEKEIIRNKIVSNQNELTSCKIDDRLYQRLKLSGGNINFRGPMGRPVSLVEVMGANQKKITELRKAILELLDLYRDASTEVPLEKELGSVILEK